MAEPQPYIRYKRPPINERVITAYAVMDKDEFAIKEESWKSVALAASPYFNPRVQWDVNIDNKDGIPKLADGGPKMTIHHWFMQHRTKNENEEVCAA